MVAPIQGTIGKSSNDPATQDSLNELTNFYAKPENEGIESEFVAPDGSKFKITDASYLARVKSNVNSGKLEGNKEVSQNADTSVDDYQAKKKEQADKADGNNAPAGNDAPAGGGSSGGKSLGDCFKIVAKADSTVAVGNQTVETNQAEVAGSQEKISKMQDTLDKKSSEQTEGFKKMQETNQVLKAQTVQAQAKAQVSFAKAKAKREAMAAKAADAATEEDSTAQSGSKMGFEGKLMTTAPASSGGGGGSAATDKAWENTMNGKITTQTKLIKAEEPKLVNIQAEGEKAATPFKEQSDASLKSADLADDNKGQVIDQGRGQMVTQGAVAVGSAIAADTAAGNALVQGGIAVANGWNAVGIAAGIKCALYTIGAIAALAGAVMGVKGVFDAADNTNNTIAGMRAEQAKLEAQSSEQLAQGDMAYNKAAKQAQLQNAKIMKATASLNKVSQECTAGLSSSSIGAVNTDGMDEDQLETVKQDRYDQIMAHEQEHASIIGGSPVIETDANGVAVGGYVAIDVPSLDEGDLEGTIERAQQVIDAALAPADPSSQDQSIASQAKDVLSRAQDMMAEKAEKAEDNKDEEKVEEPKEEVQEEVIEEPKAEAKKAA